MRFATSSRVSPEEPDGSELLVEPLGLSPARTYQEALRKSGIPLTQFTVSDVQNSYERMTKLGAVFAGSQQKWDRRPWLCLTILAAISYSSSRNKTEYAAPSSSRRSVIQIHLHAQQKNVRKGTHRISQRWQCLGQGENGRWSPHRILGVVQKGRDKATIGALRERRAAWRMDYLR